jgi:hypothetical protein
VDLAAWRRRHRELERAVIRTAIRLAALALALVTTAACSVDRRTDDLACDDDDDCDDGRDCIDGYCVYGGGDDGDDPDADPSCPAPCTFCTGTPGVDRTCHVECSGSGVCPEAIDCPPGLICQVNCNGSGACEGGVECGEAASCMVLCNGNGACDDGVECGGGPCEVTCIGNGACDFGVDCNASCACDVDCAAGACDTGVECTAVACESPTGCSSDPDGCTTCD